MIEIATDNQVRGFASITDGLNAAEELAMYEVKQKNKKTTETTAADAGKLRVETVDNWHRAWPAVLSHIQSRGSAQKLLIDLDGWLSARQVVLVAFVGDEVAAHVCFGVSPTKKCVQAQVLSFGIEPRFRKHEIEVVLRAAAMKRAKELQCGQLVGFKLADEWD
jgi:hypothetical protein